MIPRAVGVTLTTFVGLIASACGSPTSPGTQPANALTVSVVPTVLGVGETGQASASVSSGKASSNVTSSTAWHSSNPGIASISSGGAVVGLASGRIDISGLYQGMAATVSVRVLSSDDFQLTYAVGAGGGVRLDGSVVWSMSVGQVMSLTPRAIFDKTNISSTVYDVLPRTRETWATSDVGVVSVTSSGQVSALAPGVADVTATWLGKTASVHITVQ